MVDSVYRAALTDDSPKTFPPLLSTSAPAERSPNFFIFHLLQEMRKKQRSDGLLALLLHKSLRAAAIKERLRSVTTGERIWRDEMCGHGGGRFYRLSSM
jgi:hypothetical protein